MPPLLHAGDVRPRPWTLNRMCTLDPGRETLNSRPCTLNPEPQPLNPNPTLYNPQPSTPNQGSKEKLWEQDHEDLLKRLEMSLKLNDAYQELYRVTKEKLQTQPKVSVWAGLRGVA